MSDMQIGQNNEYKVSLYRNRSEIEAEVLNVGTGELTTRIPTIWKKTENKLDYHSVSKISTYERCPRKLFDEYIDSDNSGMDNGNIFSWFGTILHEVAENAKKLWTENGIKADPVLLYDTAWQDNKLTDFAMYKEGKDLIIDYFKRHPIGSDRDKLLSTELEWRGQLGGVTFGLMIDYIGEVTPEMGIIKDYKTNRMPYTPQELENSLQLAIYEVVARRLYPQYKRWITGYEMFRFGWQQCPERSEEELRTAEQYVANIAHQIEHDNVWEEKLNNYCGYCRRRYKCKAYEDFCNDPEKHIVSAYDQIDFANMESIDSARESMTKFEKIAKGRKDELNAIMKMAIEDKMASGEKLIIGDSEYELYSQGTESYNFVATRNTLMKHGKVDILEKCLTIGKTKLDIALKNVDPAVLLDLQQCKSKSYSSAYVIKKKIK